MNLKKITTVILSGFLCLSGTYTGLYTANMACAYTLYAGISSISVKKDTIAVGEKVQLELQWSNGAKREVCYTSSDENVADVDEKGIITGVSDGTTEISVAIVGNENNAHTICVSVSEDAEISTTYNTSELFLGAKLKKYDTIHYTGKGAGSYANVVNSKGSYDMAFISEKDYTLPFDAELVGIDGLAFYIAPETDGITYTDGRKLSPGDVVDKNSHLLCYDYKINNYTLPVFLPQYFGQYIGDGTIMVKEIDHEKKTITLESVCENNYTQRISIVDYDTGKFIDFDKNEVYMISFHTGYEVEYIMNDGSFAWGTKWGPTSEWAYNVHNPYIIEISDDDLGGFGVSSYEATEIDLPYEYYLPDDYIKTVENENSADIKIRLKKTITGDVGGDGSFDVADILMLQRWMLNISDTAPVNLKAADLNKDGQINVSDVCIMKNELLDNYNTASGN